MLLPAKDPACRKGPSSRQTGSGGRSAFSLLELLITLAVLIVLTTLLWSNSSASYQRNRQRYCRDNLQKCYLALQVYANDHGGQFPVVATAKTAETPLSLLVPVDTADTAIFICPGTSDAPPPSGEPFDRRKISYAYYMGRRSDGSPAALMSDRQVDTAAKTAGQQLFSATGKPPGNNHYKYGGNLLFTDGRAEFSPPRAAWPLPVEENVVLLNPKP